MGYSIVKEKAISINKSFLNKVPFYYLFIILSDLSLNFYSLNIQ